MTAASVAARSSAPACGASGHGETSAQRHARTCGRMGWPRTNPDVEGER